VNSPWSMLFREKERDKKEKESGHMVRTGMAYRYRIDKTAGTEISVPNANGE
jgi:hypothetical protein